MKPKTLIPFVVILAVLGGLVVFRNAQKKPENIVEQSGLQTVTAESVTADSIKRIELNAGAKPEEKVTLQREGEGWIVASHFNAPVTKDTIDGYLKKLTGMRGEPRATAANEEALATYSLKDGDAFHVKAFGDGEEPVIHLLFGKAPDFKSVFFRKAGDQQVYVEANDLRKEAGVTGEDMTTAPKPDKWMNKEIAKIEQDKVTKFAFKMPDKEYTLERREIPQEAPAEEKKEGEAAGPTPPPAPKKEWVMASGGLGEKVKEAGVERIFSRLRAFNASNLIDPAKKAELGLDNPPFRVAISREGEADLVLLGAHKDLAGPGHLMIEGAAKEVIYEVSKFNFEYLFLKGGDLYDLPKLALEADKIDRIELTSPAGPAIFVKNGDTWTAEEPKLDFKLDQEKVKELATTAAAIQMQDYADAATAAFTHSVTVQAGDVKRTIQGAGAAATFDGVYASVDGDAKTYAINKLEADKLFLTPKDFYSLTPFTLSAADITGVTLQSEGKNVQLSQAGEAWSVVVDGVAPIPGDGERIKGLTDMLATLRFNDIHSEARAADWAPLMTIDFTTKDGAAHKLNVSPLEGDMHLVQLDANPSLFKLDVDNVNTFKYHFNAVQTAGTPAADAAPADAAAAPAEAVPAPAANLVELPVNPAPAEAPGVAAETITLAPPAQ